MTNGKKEGYRTPKGKDETLTDLPPRYKHLAGVVTAHKYRNGVVLKGGQYTTTLIDEISNKLKRNKSVVGNVTGPPGIGKTWYAIALAQFFDPKFHILDSPAPDPWIDTGQVCFTRDHIKHLIGENSPLKRGQAIVLDEAHFGLGARGFQQRDQINMVNLISAIRSKGFLLLIVTLHSSMLDKIPREYVVNYEFAVKNEGVAKVYSRYFPTFAKKAYNKGKGSLEVCLPDPFDPKTGRGCDHPGCLTCEFMKATDETRCWNIRALYERRKEEFINKMSANGEDDAPTKRTQVEIIEIIHDNRERLKINAHKRIDVAGIIAILQENGLPCSVNPSYSVRNAYETAYPEVLLSLVQGDTNP